jgi:hypothetical protein
MITTLGKSGNTSTKDRETCVVLPGPRCAGFKQPRNGCAPTTRPSPAPGSRQPNRRGQEQCAVAPSGLARAGRRVCQREVQEAEDDLQNALVSGARRSQHWPGHSSHRHWRWFALRARFSPESPICDVLGLAGCTPSPARRFLLDACLMRLRGRSRASRLRGHLRGRSSYR